MVGEQQDMAQVQRWRAYFRSERAERDNEPEVLNPFGWWPPRRSV
jgi:hypothetical protein